MYFDFRTWAMLLRLALREPSLRRRISLVWTLLVPVPAMALFTAICFALDPLLFPRLREVKVSAPVFLVGHARSGTTLAHRLMGEDRRFSAFLYWELFAPSLLQKKLVHWIAAFDRRFLDGALERRVRSYEQKKFGPSQHIHRMGFTIPEEDDFVLTRACASGYWIVQLPYMGELDFYHIDRRPPASRARLMRYYRECVRRQLYVNGSDRIHLSKNPVFAGRIESLIECFPDARFVFLYRNPLETIPSLLKLMKTSWKMRHFEEQSMQRSFAVMIEQSFHTYRYPLEVMARHPHSRAAIVEYEALCAHPRETIERVYRELDLPMTPQYAARLRELAERTREHDSAHRYSLQEFGLSAADIHRNLADLFERFHWETPAVPEKGARMNDPVDGSDAARLRAAWDELIADLQRARDALDKPELHPPPSEPRVLAEGYRYLLGFLYGSIQRAIGPTPQQPYFVRAIQPLNRSTIDNADAVYLCAPIDGTCSYRIRARAADTRHWRGEPRVAGSACAPHYVIFETPSGYAGDTGSIREMAPGSRANGGTLEGSELQVETDGSFEILLAPERPSGHTGNFLATRALRTRTKADGTQVSREYISRFVVLRELFYDWRHEQLLDLEIAPLDAGSVPALDPAQAEQALRSVGELTRNQLRFWNEFYAVAMEAYGDTNGDGECFIPRNRFNEPNAASLATGGGMSTNIYAGGIYELGPEEAMLVELRQPVEPDYIGFHLANLWGESADFANHQSSLNAFQAERDADGVIRLVIAHRDPGIANWIDTTGLLEAWMSVRWAYKSKPTQQQLLPRATATKLRFDEIGARLPAARRVTAEERRAVIAMRQRHVQYRYRMH